MAKIVKVERNVKNKSVYFFTLPRRILSYQKIVKVERNVKNNPFIFLHCRDASYPMWQQRVYQNSK